LEQKPNPIKNIFIQLDQMVFRKVPIWLWIAFAVFVGMFGSLMFLAGSGGSGFSIALFASPTMTASNTPVITSTFTLLPPTDTPRMTNTSAPLDTLFPTDTLLPTNPPLPTNTRETIGGGHGQIIFESDRDGDLEIYRYDLSTRRIVKLTDNESDDRHPAWSPNGQKIVFVSDRNGRQEVYTMHADGSHQEQQTISKSSKFYPNWGPNGTILFVERTGKGSPHSTNPEDFGCKIKRFFLSDPTMIELHLTYDITCWGYPKYSPSGRMWAYTNWEEDDLSTNIYWREPLQGRWDSVYHDVSKDADIAWAPNERRFAYASYVTIGGHTDWEIATVGINGNGHDYLTSNNAEDRGPSWSPDGNYIVYYSDQDGDYELYIITDSGKHIDKLTDNGAYDGYPVWRP
jgi:TolB protein